MKKYVSYLTLKKISKLENDRNKEKRDILKKERQRI